MQFYCCCFISFTLSVQMWIGTVGMGIEMLGNQANFSPSQKRHRNIYIYKINNLQNDYEDQSEIFLILWIIISTDVIQTCVYRSIYTGIIMSMYQTKSCMDEKKHKSKVTVYKKKQYWKMEIVSYIKITFADSHGFIFVLGSFIVLQVFYPCSHLFLLLYQLPVTNICTYPYKLQSTLHV